MKIKPRLTRKDLIKGDASVLVGRKVTIHIKAYLVIKDLRDPIEVHLDQAKQLINLSYIGKLADEQRALLMDLKRVPVMPRWALNEFAGEVYLEVMG